MKKLDGLKNGFSTLDNEKLKNVRGGLLSPEDGGGKVSIRSNITRAHGAVETDVYDRAPDGTLINGRRSWVLMQEPSVTVEP